MLLIAPRYKLEDKAPDAGTVNEAVAKFLVIVKLLDPVLETVINPNGPDVVIPEVGILFMEPVIEVESVVIENEELGTVSELVSYEIIIIPDPPLCVAPGSFQIAPLPPPVFATPLA